MSHRFKVITQC